MKKLIFVVVVLTAVAFAFGTLAAQKTSPSPAKAADVWYAAVGTIEKIDAAAKTLEVKTMKKVSPKKPAEVNMMTIAVDNKTKIFILAEKHREKIMSFDYLKTGMTIWLTYTVEGSKNTAKSIEVRPH
jgi:hypothetical protein